jgi:hypothetical protein
MAEATVAANLLRTKYQRGTSGEGVFRANTEIYCCNLRRESNVPDGCSQAPGNAPLPL